MPPYVVLNMKDRSHVAWGGYLGKQYDPFVGKQARRLFELPRGLDHGSRARSRRTLAQQFDRLRARPGRERLDGSDGPLRAAGRRHRGGRPRARGLRSLARAARRSRALRRHRLVPAGAAGAAAGRSGRELCHDRPEQPLRVRHVGHARRQHSALRRHLERAAAAAAGVRSSDHHAGERSRRARAARRRAGDRDGRIRPHADSWARKAAPTAAITGRS